MRLPSALATLLLIVIGVCVANVASAASAIVPIDVTTAEPAAVFASATYLDDPNAAYSIDDVSRGSMRTAFAPFPRGRLSDRVVRGWFRFALRAPAGEAARWTLDANSSCDVFDIYVPRPTGTHGVIHAGMLVPFARRGRDIPDPGIVLTSDVTGGQPLYVYVNSNRTTPGRVLFHVFDTAGLSADQNEAATRNAFFGGLIFAIIVTNAFLGIYLRDRLFFAYVVAMAFHVLT